MLPDGHLSGAPRAHLERSELSLASSVADARQPDLAEAQAISSSYVSFLTFHASCRSRSRPVAWVNSEFTVVHVHLLLDGGKVSCDDGVDAGDVGR